ncbi:hypothetical protein COJ00_27910 [Priestia megaterium]|uniref:hypothetical protein n=1 Tax=Priestia megaterium TaxID=1404 RepID=UPI000BF3CFCD|nr:hypothetical protein [Priestia megaterium]PFJ39407.1 hypothetical protein COJ00_27910 [Priestia megaterium]
MGNCKKQERKRSEFDINELFKRFKLASKQIQKSLRDIEGLLKRSQGLMQRLQITSNNGLANRNTFFQVAEAPAVPTPAPSPPTPQAPVTGIQQGLINNIFSTVREIGRVRAQIRNTVEAAIGGFFLLRRALREFNLQRGQEIALGIMVLISQIENLTLELEELQEDLDINIVLLANTVL